MLLINLHPLEPQRRKVRARRAAMTTEQRATARDAEAARQRGRRLANPELVRAYELRQYEHGTRKANNLAAGWRSKLRDYGLTVEDYERLVEKQGNRCACCGASEPGRGHVRWCVDHDHATGLVRGLLCHRCNAGIGLLGDNLESVMRAVIYLEGAKSCY